MHHSLEIFENGQASVRDARVGEAMHSSIGPDEEARIVYLAPSRLAERLAERTDRPLVLFDVGLGIAANALGALETPRRRPLHIHSFENSFAGLALALDDPARFPRQARNRAAIGSLLTRGSYEDSATRWFLHRGDFRAQDLAALPRPELIYYDFFSPRSSPELWNVEIFRALRTVSAPCGTTLLTYSASTSVRAALLLAGFHVGHGVSTEKKLETTIASTKVEALERPLGKAWLEKLDRSGAPLPGSREAIRTALEIQA